MRRGIGITLAFLFFAASAYAVRQLVILEEPQLAQRVEGVVLDPNGDPIAGMTVTDRTEDGITILRSTSTDAGGYFRFSTQRGKSIYCIRFDHRAWNPLQVTIKLDKRAHQRGITAKPQIGG